MAKIRCECGQEFETADGEGTGPCPKCGRPAPDTAPAPIEPLEDTPSLPESVSMPSDLDESVPLVSDVHDETPPSFWDGLRAAPRYPLTPGGILMLITGTLFFYAMDVLALAPLFGWVLWLLVAGYFCAYWMDVVAESASGSEDPPEWPDISYWADDVLKPSLRFLVTVLAAFVPAGVALVAETRLGIPSMEMGGRHVYMLTWFFAGLGMLCLPMALCRVSVLRCVDGKNLPFVLRAMFKFPVQYYVAVSLFFIGITLVAASFVGAWLGLWGLVTGSPIMLLLLLVKLPGFYLLVLSGRIVGLFYWCNQKALGPP